MPRLTKFLRMTTRKLEKVYEPQQAEVRWGQFWISQSYFTPKDDSPDEVYAMVIPPPNVTGSLHIGHALNTTLQDILIRWQRMQGRNTLWIPGTDHAGIATQNVVERQLLDEGTSREQLGRDAFIDRVWAWKKQSGNTIIEQLKRLGASCDWTRLRFTMDDSLSSAVREVFVSLYEENLIYRGERLINWCPRCLTALSDIEVEHEQINGKLYHIRYPLVDNPHDALIIATTRPETMFGDTAIAVHPEDARYNQLIGKLVQLPLTTRSIKIVGDSILVEQELGTGAVKITPAHDFNDFEAGERHHLTRISILDHRACLDHFTLKFKSQVDNSILSTLSGVSVSKARTIVVEELKARNCLIKTEDYKLALGKCYRCKTVIEPYLSTQWFVKIQSLAEPAIKVVESGQIRIIPESWTNNYLGWMRGIKDWCISRQIWWGHRVPAWYCRSCQPDVFSTTKSDGIELIPRQANPIVTRTPLQKCPRCGSLDVIQDPDVLDTWFSSALWPLSTLGWPHQTKDLKTFYPTSTLVTGLDILFFWVARMIMIGLKFTGKVPFRDVYIHALVRDAEGQKMSKSKGNVIDPLTKMSQYGTDALRFTLASMASPGRDIKLAEERIEGYRNFTNKIWNAARFILMHTEGRAESTPVKERSLVDRWILSRTNRVIELTNKHLSEYRFDQAANQLYHFTWHTYCDWYLELIKPALQSENKLEVPYIHDTMLLSFETLLRLLHPFMPFVTEEIWQNLPHQGESLAIQTYPAPRKEWHAKDAEDAFHVLEQFVTTARTGRSLLEYPPLKTLTLYGSSGGGMEREALWKLHGHLEWLSKGTITLTEQDNWPTNHILRLVTGETTVGLQVEGEVDLRKALGRIQKQIQAKQKEVSRLQSRLSSSDFTAKASPDVIQESEIRLRSLSQELPLLFSSEQQLQEMV